MSSDATYSIHLDMSYSIYLTGSRQQVGVRTSESEGILMKLISKQIPYLLLFSHHYKQIISK